MRIFVSIGWSSEILEYLQACQNKLQEAGVKGYWRRGQNLHLTLKFLGEVEPTFVEKIDEALEKAKRGIKPFLINIKGLGVFPNPANPRILWAGLDSHDLMLLQSSVERELESLGFPREQRSYKPHITLASGGISNISMLKELGHSLSATDNISQFKLMQSIVEKGIRKYRVIRSFKLQ